MEASGPRPPTKNLLTAAAGRLYSHRFSLLLACLDRHHHHTSTTLTSYSTTTVAIPSPFLCYSVLFHAALFCCALFVFGTLKLPESWICHELEQKVALQCKWRTWVRRLAEAEMGVRVGRNAIFISTYVHVCFFAIE